MLGIVGSGMLLTSVTVQRDDCENLNIRSVHPIIEIIIILEPTVFVFMAVVNARASGTDTLITEVCKEPFDILDA
ncbi:hypothetical protein D3C71_2008560 [compost metagenome]